MLYGTFSAPFGFLRATPFNLVSFDAAPAWSDNLQLTVVGSLLGVQQYSSVLNLTGPFTLETLSFNWTNIDRVDISTSGGTDNPIAGPLTGPWVAIDRLSATNVVPEPSTYLLVAVGLSALAMVRRRKA